MTQQETLDWRIYRQKDASQPLSDFVATDFPRVVLDKKMVSRAAMSLLSPACRVEVWEVPRE